MSSRRRSFTTTVEADVDLVQILSEMDDDELQELLAEVKRHVPVGGVFNELADALRYQPDPLPRVRQIVSDVTGRVL